jgi:hypothetical protein
MMHPKLRWDADALWPGNHNFVIGECGFFTTPERTSKCVHLSLLPYAVPSIGAPALAHRIAPAAPKPAGRDSGEGGP